MRHPARGVVSPLLANLYFNRMLKGWRQTGRGKQFRAHIVNYADDFVILSSRKAAESLEWTRGVLSRLGLKLNEKKTSIRNARKQQFDFLGYTFGPHISRKTGQEYLGCSPSKKSVTKAKQNVREHLKPQNVTPWSEVRDRLNQKLKGCRITLHSVVYDPAKQSVMPTAAYFKLQSLSTFVHEVAHHFDHTRRVARGRWRADESGKAEQFAYERQHEWTQTCVVPYLEEAYPRDVAELLDLLEVNGKVHFTFGELIHDPRRSYVSHIERAVDELLQDITKETPRIERLLNFTLNLKIADMYARSQEVIDHILLEAPDDENALELRANVWIFQEKYAEAARLALHVLGRNPQKLHARWTLTRAYEGLEQWDNVIDTATESLTLFDKDWDRLNAVASRCSAYWMLGKKDESDEDFRTLESFGRPSWRIKRISREREKAQ